MRYRLEVDCLKHYVKRLIDDGRAKLLIVSLKMMVLANEPRFNFHDLYYDIHDAPGIMTNSFKVATDA